MDVKKIKDILAVAVKYSAYAFLLYKIVVFASEEFEKMFPDEVKKEPEKVENEHVGE